MLHYILQTIAFQLFFLIVYDVFLKKETFFNWNRVYLLSTSVLSLILPFIRVESFKSVVPEEFVITLPEILLGKRSAINEFSNNNDATVGFTFSWELLFYIGIAITAIIFIYKLIRLLFLIYKNPKRWKGNLLIIKLINSNAAFSFFHYIFLGEYIKSEDESTILNHEIVHVKHKHTFDLLFFEILRIVFWFNPLIYIYQNKITTLHEYIADAKAIKSQNRTEYYQNLLSQIFETKNFSFTNTFFKQSLIKKRIIMLSKTKSNQILKFKYALLIPLVFGMLLYTSCEKETVIEEEEIVLSELTETIAIAEFDPESSDIENIFPKQSDFLKSQPNYVRWMIFNPETKTITSSVHHKNEVFPKRVWMTGTIEKENGSTLTTHFMGEKEGKEIPYLVEEIEDEVPFATIDEIPTFSECEGLPQEEQRKCVSSRITSYVQKNFNTNLAGDLNLNGRQRISVLFKIDVNGNITGVRSRAPHPDLEKEAKRVIESLPKMKPGKHNGKNVNVPYMLPIIFQINE